MVTYAFLIQEAMVWPLEGGNVFETPVPNNRPVTYKPLKEKCVVQNNPTVQLQGYTQQKCGYMLSKDTGQSVHSSVI